MEDGGGRGWSAGVGAGVVGRTFLDPLPLLVEVEEHDDDNGRETVPGRHLVERGEDVLGDEEHLGEVGLVHSVSPFVIFRAFQAASEAATA
jgi:hypothetical protein